MAGKKLRAILNRFIERHKLHMTQPNGYASYYTEFELCENSSPALHELLEEVWEYADFLQDNDKEDFLRQLQDFRYALVRHGLRNKEDLLKVKKFFTEECRPMAEKLKSYAALKPVFIATASIPKRSLRSLSKNVQ